MKAMISSQPAKEVLMKMSESTNEVIAMFEPHSISIDSSEMKNLRTMGEGRVGIARSMSMVAVNYEECLPRYEEPNKMADLMHYHHQLAALHTKLGKLYEMVGDTLAGLGADIIKMYDRYYSHFQTARLHNGNLDIALSPFDEYNKRFGHRQDEEEKDTPDTTDSNDTPAQPEE